MDRFVPPFLGRRRGWMPITQLGAMATILLMSCFQPSQSMTAIAVLALLLAFFSASQDIVLDAYRTERLAENERGAGSAVWIMGYWLALLVGAAAALILSDIISWHMVYTIMAGTMLIGCISTLLCREPGNDGTSLSEGFAPTNGIREAIVLPSKDFFSRPGAMEVILFIIIYKVGDVAAGQMTTPYILQHIGFSNTELGYVYKGFGMVATIIGTLVGGAILSKWSLKRGLIIFGVLQGVSTLSFIMLSYAGRDLSVLALVIATENVTGGMGTAAYTALLMSLCNTQDLPLLNMPSLVL